MQEIRKEDGALQDKATAERFWLILPFIKFGGLKQNEKILDLS